MKKIILVSLLTLAFVPARCEGVQQQAQDITLQQQQLKGGVVIAKRVEKVLGLALAGGLAGVAGARMGYITLQ